MGADAAAWIGGLSGANVFVGGDGQSGPVVVGINQFLLGTVSLQHRRGWWGDDSCAVILWGRLWERFGSHGWDLLDRNPRRNQYTLYGAPTTTLWLWCRGKSRY